MDQDQVTRTILGLFDRVWISESEIVKREFFEHFKVCFLASGHSQLTMLTTFRWCLLVDQSSWLALPFTWAEVKCVGWDCGSENSPCPDGFTFYYLKRFWFVEGNVMQLVLKFNFIIRGVFLRVRAILNLLF